MTEPVPSIGRIVHYRLSEEDAHKINRRRNDATEAAHMMIHTGFLRHVGSSAYGGQIVSMIITLVLPASINGQAVLDGNDSFWLQSVQRGDEPGTWDWPPQI